MKLFPEITDKLLREMRKLKALKRFDGVCVLVVEDEKGIAYAIKDFLETMGCEAILAHTGEDAIREVQEGHIPDFIFLDLNLPKMNGAQTIRVIRSMHPDIPVVVVTGYPDSNMLNEVMQMGYVGLVTKPLMPSNIARILTQHRMDPEHFQRSNGS